MKITSSSFADGAPIPGEFAFAVPHAQNHIELSSNRNPHLEWSGAPAGTKSFVLVCHDYDVPSRGDDVNKEGRTVPKSLPRVDFHHWVLVDIPASVTSIAAGAHSSAITARGKAGPQAPGGMRHGINDYTAWFAGDKDMGGDYHGYDGPCPPWNDEILHHYVFTVYALDIEACPVSGRFGGADVLKAIEGHVLAKASITGTYALNPAVRG
jgi:Raf kinase inhibitor-like YbhB/YbcL family protein